MTNSEIPAKLKWIIWLLAGNLVVMILGTTAIAFGLLPKMERAIQASERVEARFQAFADDVQPVVTAGAGKAIETIGKMDAEQLSETATEKADTLLDAAAERAKRYLDRDEDSKDE